VHWCCLIFCGRKVNLSFGYNSLSFGQSLTIRLASVGHYGKAINEGRVVHEATFKIAWSVKIGG